MISKEAKHGMTFTAAWSNLSNCAVGSGILSIPFAFAQMGIIMSVCVYVLVTLSSWIGMYLLARTTAIISTLTVSSSQQRLSPNSYRDLVHILLGPLSTVCFQLMILTYCFSILVGYLIIIEELFPPVLRWLQVIGITITETQHFSHFTLLSAVIGLILPISLIRTRSHFKYLSVGAIVCVLYFVFLLSFESSVNPFEGLERMPCWKHDHDIHLFNDVSSAIIGIPIICFALGGHLQSVSLFTELTHSGEIEEYIDYNSKIWAVLHKWAVTTALSMLFLSVIYALVGFVSYICMIVPGREPYGADILQHMIDSDPNDGFIQSASLSVGIVLVLSYPLFSFPLRAIVDGFFVYLLPSLNENVSIRTRYNVETLLIVMSSYVVAITIGNVKVMFGLIGATGAVFQQFFLPAVLYLLARNYSGRKNEPRSLVLGTFLVMVVGCIVGTAAAFKIFLYSSNL